MDSLRSVDAHLPVTPNFKGNPTGLYKFNVAGFPSLLQGSVLHQTGSRTFLEPASDGRIGDLPAVTTVDFSAGIMQNNWKMTLFIQNACNERGALQRNAQCTVGECDALARIYPAKPMLLPFG